MRHTCRYSHAVGLAVLLRLIVSSIGGAPLFAADARVEFELAAGEKVAQQRSQDWYKLLVDLKVDGLRLRQAGASDRPKLESLGSPESPRYKVTGVILDRGDLYVPGARFSAGDRAGISKWIANLRSRGPGGGEPEKPLPYGLTRPQFEQVHTDLSQTVEFSTVEKTRREAMAAIAKLLSFPVRDEGGLEAALAEDEAPVDELKGISCGTALAYLLRPIGMTLEIGGGKGAQVAYLLRSGKESREPWPVGTKPQKDERELLPVLLEVLESEIDNVPLPDALAALQGRLKVPFLYDRNSMARQGIEMAKVKANVPSRRSTYLRLLSRTLNSVKLKYELRVDEADHPFVWITTFKP